MPIEFLCEHCGTKLRTPDGSTGKKTKCPQCEAILTIPESQQSPSQTPSPPPPPPLQRPRSEAPGEWQGFENFPGMADFQESGNPWQAPVDDGPESPALRRFNASGVTGDRLGFSQAFSMTYETFKSNFLPFFVLGLIAIGFIAASFAVNMVLSMVMEQDPGMSVIYMLLVFFNAYVVQPLLMLGLNLCALELIRTRKTSFATGFSILTSIISLILFGILMMLIAVFVVYLPCVAFFLAGMAIDSAVAGGPPGVGTVIGVILAVVWGIFAGVTVMFRLMMFGPLLLVDQKVSATRAISLSWGMTKGNTRTLFYIYLVFGLLGCIGVVVTLFLGHFIFIPFAFCLLAMCYHIMWEQYSGRTSGQQTSEW